MTRVQALCVAARRVARRLGPLSTGLPPNELLDRQNAARRAPTAESRAFVRRILESVQRG